MPAEGTDTEASMPAETGKEPDQVDAGALRATTAPLGSRTSRERSSAVWAPIPFTVAVRPLVQVRSRAKTSRSARVLITPSAAYVGAAPSTSGVDVASPWSSVRSGSPAVWIRARSSWVLLAAAYSPWLHWLTAR